jgi:hypothetical protein
VPFRDGAWPCCWLGARLVGLRRGLGQHTRQRQRHIGAVGDDCPRRSPPPPPRHAQRRRPRRPRRARSPRSTTDAGELPRGGTRPAGGARGSSTRPATARTRGAGGTARAGRRQPAAALWRRGRVACPRAQREPRRRPGRAAPRRRSHGAAQPSVGHRGRRRGPPVDAAAGGRGGLLPVVEPGAGRGHALDRLDAGRPALRPRPSVDAPLRRAPGAPCPPRGILLLAPERHRPRRVRGPNDVWHSHLGLCFVGGRIYQEGMPHALACPGEWLAGDDLWMLHAWVVPGVTNSLGRFAPQNPALCPAAGAAVPVAERCRAGPPATATPSTPSADGAGS